MKKVTGLLLVFVLVLAMLSMMGFYSLLFGKGDELREDVEAPVSGNVVGVNKAISTSDTSRDLAPPNVDTEVAPSIVSTPIEQPDSAAGAKNTDRFAAWFNDFHYSESQEGVSTAVDVEWSLKGPPKPTPHSDILVDLWANQKYDELDAFAEERLRKDPKDKVARLLRMENAALNGSVEEYYQSCGDVLEVIKKNNPGYFSALCAILVRQIKSSLYAMEARSPEELEKAKASIRSTIAAEAVKGRTFPMRVQNYIKALELDGYWGEE